MASEKCRERVVQKEGLPSRLRPAEKYYFDDSQAAPLKELSNRQCQIEIVVVFTEIRILVVENMMPGSDNDRYSRSLCGCVVPRSVKFKLSTDRDTAIHTNDILEIGGS